MKPATAKRKGAETEIMFVNYLHSQGVHNAERRHLVGKDDKGDIAAWVYPDGSHKVTVEVKSGASLSIPQWLRELDSEIKNSDADTGFIAVRPKGKPNPEDWFAVLPMDVLMRLMAEAGYIHGREA